LFQQSTCNTTIIIYRYKEEKEKREEGWLYIFLFVVLFVCIENKEGGREWRR